MGELKRQLKAPGIIETDVEQCERQLLRYQRWDHKIFFPFDQVAYLYAHFNESMTSAFNMYHKELLERMDSYSTYYKALPDYRGPSQDYEDCGDLCPSSSVYVGAIAVENVTFTKYREPRMGICLVAFPEVQNFRYKACESDLAINIPPTTDYKMKYACVPDGFIRRKIIVYCPDAPMQQCREVDVSVPMACSPKYAKCHYNKDYFTKKMEKMAKGGTNKQAGNKFLGRILG